MTVDPDKKDKIYLENVEKIGNSTQNIYIVENVISKEEHEKLLNFVIQIDEWEKKPWGVYRFGSEKMPDEIVNTLSKIFKIAYDTFVRIYDVQVETPRKNQFSLVKFEEGYAMELHVDTMSVSELHLASVYYINDDYGGGEISFPDHDLVIKPNANSLILFPGNENYWHETLEVIKNNRYTSNHFFKFAGSTFSGKTPKEHNGIAENARFKAYKELNQPLNEDYGRIDI
jgi:hypothetical protein